MLSLLDVNISVNRLPYKSDAAKYNVEDFWKEADENGGDCEDFALAKLRRLVDAGWPIESLRLATVFVETGEYHAVLVASDIDGDFVLDNRESRPIPIANLANLGYRPDKIQRIGGSQEWVQWIK